MFGECRRSTGSQESPGRLLGCRVSSHPFPFIEGQSGSSNVRPTAPCPPAQLPSRVLSAGSQCHRQVYLMPSCGMYLLLPDFGAGIVLLGDSRQSQLVSQGVLLACRDEQGIANSRCIGQSRDSSPMSLQRRRYQLQIATQKAGCSMRRSSGRMGQVEA